MIVETNTLKNGAFLFISKYQYSHKVYQCISDSITSTIATMKLWILLWSAWPMFAYRTVTILVMA